jgi:hypothetical protein
MNDKHTQPINSLLRGYQHWLPVGYCPTVYNKSNYIYVYSIWYYLLWIQGQWWGSMITNWLEYLTLYYLLGKAPHIAFNFVLYAALHWLVALVGRIYTAVHSYNACSFCIIWQPINKRCVYANPSQTPLINWDQATAKWYISIWRFSLRLHKLLSVVRIVCWLACISLFFCWGLIPQTEQLLVPLLCGIDPCSSIIVSKRFLLIGVLFRLWFLMWMDE